MKRLIMVGLMALGAAVGSTAASAAPATSNVAGLSQSTSGIELAQYRGHGDYRRHRHFRERSYRHRHYRGNDRYRGWHRHHHRPHGWRSRGCVAVGPVWMCP
ncbi:hypothetical protein DLM45_03135 [Hyphomicrobium methylovorum]|uniref:hypothetical protein n=1 Tax=Hyphomicrobium methylovorum TaxID=84 RepID=UPI0015E71FA6|nr:hypothetical protein [Hyphomicrobium methylovorum]MBA2125218.1 hypothetical protein [Hyphomicrobium methylovorum]